MAALTAFSKINSIIASKCITLESLDFLQKLGLREMGLREKVLNFPFPFPQSQNYTHEVYVDRNPVQIEVMSDTVRNTV